MDIFEIRLSFVIMLILLIYLIIFLSFTLYLFTFTLIIFYLSFVYDVKFLFDFILFCFGDNIRCPLIIRAIFLSIVDHFYSF